jgi:hypothetical protein
LIASLFKKGLSENVVLRHCRRDKPAQRFRRNANLFKKGLIENPKQRRDQTAQRLRLNGFGSTLALKRAELQ